MDGDKSFRCVSSVLLTGDTSREDDRLALPELTSTFKGRPNEGVDPPLPDFSGDVEEADITEEDQTTMIPDVEPTIEMTDDVPKVMDDTKEVNLSKFSVESQ